MLTYMIVIYFYLKIILATSILKYIRYISNNFTKKDLLNLKK